MNVVERGAAARSLLDSPVWVEATDRYKRHLYEVWESCEDPEWREHHWYEIQALKKIAIHLESFVNDGVYESSKKAKWNKS